MCRWYRNAYACSHIGELTRDRTGCDRYDRQTAKCEKGKLNPSIPHVDYECGDCQVKRPAPSHQVNYCFLEGSTPQMTLPYLPYSSPLSKSIPQFSGPTKQSDEPDEYSADLTEFGFMYSYGQKRKPKEDLNKTLTTKRSKPILGCSITDAADIPQIPMVDPAFLVEQDSKNVQPGESRGEASRPTLPKLRTKTDEMDWTPSGNKPSAGDSPVSPMSLMTLDLKPTAPAQPSVAGDEARKQLEEDRLAQEYYAGEFEQPTFQPAQPVKLYCGFPTYEQLGNSVIAQIVSGEYTAETIRQEATFLALTPEDQQQLLLSYEHILQRDDAHPIGPQRPIEERPKMGIRQRLKAKARQFGHHKTLPSAACRENIVFAKESVHPYACAECAKHNPTNQFTTDSRPTTASGKKRSSDEFEEDYGSEDFRTYIDKRLSRSAGLDLNLSVPPKRTRNSRGTYSSDAPQFRERRANTRGYEEPTFVATLNPATDLEFINMPDAMPQEPQVLPTNEVFKRHSPPRRGRPGSSGEGRNTMYSIGSVKTTRPARRSDSSDGPVSPLTPPRWPYGGPAHRKLQAVTLRNTVEHQPIYVHPAYQASFRADISHPGPIKALPPVLSQNQAHQIQEQIRQQKDRQLKRYKATKDQVEQDMYWGQYTAAQIKNSDKFKSLQPQDQYDLMENYKGNLRQEEPRREVPVDRVKRRPVPQRQVFERKGGVIERFADWLFGRT
ncbi:hypothetical protein H2200_006020 [Cladophialophora chaetospira]|uniref:Uncharacterized protein n=1 Tax=Cladophialophora chaetospira TaxID=386627 RepID=A0AA38XA56_9EURO|nr:hypothetical protein H2200_006020 [Cladophialophora chaetospira]